LLAVLIFDKKQLSESMLEELATDLLAHDDDERNRISEWLLANQLTKDTKLAALVETWQEHPGPNGHCNARGYALMAEFVTDAIARLPKDTSP
ncbi:MAG: hypothetical protein KDA24_26420, partial [Deltaproteobacteria bacterium]|nr:hypothetical protein [Deltaproteobacteria bacterium]